MRPSPTWAKYVIFVVASAKAVCMGDILRTTPQRSSGLPSSELFQSSPSLYYHYQQHHGRPTQQIHIEFPQQTRMPQTFPTSRPFSRFTSRAPETPSRTPPPFDEYPIDDAEQRKNTSNKLYFEDHNGNDTHREHHYRHVTVNHYYYNATNATDDDAKGKDVKHHYYYNEYEHDHRNKTEADPNTKHHYYYSDRNKTEADPNTKHHQYYSDRNKTEKDPNTKYHYYYNEYKHDHRNKTEGDPNTKHHYYYNEYKHDHRNKTEGDPNTKHHYYYNEYKHDHRNKTEGDPNTKHNYYYNEYRHDHRNKTKVDPNTNHYYNSDHRNGTEGEPSTKHHYYNNEYKHDHRNKTEVDPNTKHYYSYNEYHRNKTGRDSGTKHYYYYDHRNKTSDPDDDDQKNKTEDTGKHYYHSSYRGPSATPKMKHSSKEEEEEEEEKNSSEYDESASEDETREGQAITDAHGIEDYEYVTTPKPLVKHHHYFKEYHYKNGRLINATGAEPPEAQSPKGRFVIVKEPSYDPRFGYVGGSGYPFFGYLNNRKIPNGSVGYYLVDPLGRLPTLKIHASLLTPERRVYGFNPGALPRHPVALLQPVRRRVASPPQRHVAT